MIPRAVRIFVSTEPAPSNIAQRTGSSGVGAGAPRSITTLSRATLTTAQKPLYVACEPVVR